MQKESLRETDFEATATRFEFAPGVFRIQAWATGFFAGFAGSGARIPISKANGTCTRYLS